MREGGASGCMWSGAGWEHGGAWSASAAQGACRRLWGWDYDSAHNRYGLVPARVQVLSVGGARATRSRSNGGRLRVRVKAGCTHKRIVAARGGDCACDCRRAAWVWMVAWVGIADEYGAQRWGWCVCAGHHKWLRARVPSQAGTSTRWRVCIVRVCGGAGVSQ